MSIKNFGAALTVMVLLLSNKVWSQTYAESALQFARTAPTGSARILGLGGTQTALGGDYSSAYSNPAGLGMYNRSELTLSTGLSFFNTTAKYQGNTDYEFKPSINIPGISFVFNFPREQDDGFKGGTFAITMTRTNDFNQSTFYHGDKGTIVDSFIGIANGAPESQFDNDMYNTSTGLAYRNFLIGPATVLNSNNPDDQYFTDVPTNSSSQEKIRTNGSTSQWNFSYGGNFKDKLFFGVGLGISSLRYKSAKDYSENYGNDPNISSMDLQENLSVRGTGVNATVGITARPVNFFQIGTSISTPTLYFLSEKYDASMSSNWNNYDYYGDGSRILNNEYGETDIITSNYTLATPFKASGGIAFISKFGFITGDIDYINQKQSRYSSNTTGLSFSSDNNEIRSIYKPVINYRAGAEFRYKVLRIRAGYGVQVNTYKSNTNLDNNIKSISSGFGLRFKKYFVDVAVINSWGNNVYSPYIGASNVMLQNSLTRGVVTAGFNF
jgi:hypothetical protein